MILTTTNNMVDVVNSKIIDRLSGDTSIVRNVDYLANQNLSALYPPEFIRSINLSGVPPHETSLSINTAIMLL